MITASEPKHRNKNWGNPNPQLFDDTSSAPPAGYDHQQQGFVPQSGTVSVDVVLSSTLYLEDGQLYVVMEW